MQAVVLSEAFTWTGTVWRMVEAQHTASTMKIVDDDEEQDLLETLLEGSKPVQPANHGAGLLVGNSISILTFAGRLPFSSHN